MTKKLVLGFVALAAIGCSSNGEIICEKIMDECHLGETLFAGVSTSECAEELDKEMTESQGEDCANCIDEASCTTITNGGCDAECSF